MSPAAVIREIYEFGTDGEIIDYFDNKILIIADLIDAAEYVLDNRSNRGDNPETGETVEVVLADSLDDLAEAFRRLNREKLTAS